MALSLRQRFSRLFRRTAVKRLSFSQAMERARAGDPIHKDEMPLANYHVGSAEGYVGHIPGLEIDC